MNFKVGDKVVVISGREKGKVGTISKILRDTNKVVINGINIVKKATKGNGNTPGSIIDVEAPIHASNVMIIDPKTKKGTRIGHTIDKNGKKKRIAKKSNESID